MAKKKAPAKQGKRVRAGETWTINDKQTRGHKSTITEVKGEEIRHVPRTHSPKTRRENNIPLQDNPQKSDNRKAYIASKVRKTNIKNVGKKQENQDIKNPIDKSLMRHIKKQDKHRKRK